MIIFSMNILFTKTSVGVMALIIMKIIKIYNIKYRTVLLITCYLVEKFQSHDRNINDSCKAFI